MKTAREALEYIKQVSTGDGANLLIPMMIEFLVRHFEAGKGIDEVLEMN